ncbi:rCG31482 [Rattus norvegicus]|uniref:RCG31482 n=1 Tax=Rattus norvegicus TaxID=10116 RepID=A6IS81_RAT|nr:rCG31482 [Rattus norvegicus]
MGFLHCADHRSTGPQQRLPETPWLIVETSPCYELQCSLLFAQSSLLLCKENGFIIENRLLIFSYSPSSACKYQVGIASDYIVFEYLTLKIAV